MKCQFITPDTIVLQWANTSPVEMFLRGFQMSYTGHLNRVEDAKISEQLFNGELQHGRRLRHKPKKRLKGVKNNPNIKFGDWAEMIGNRLTRKKINNVSCKAFETGSFELSYLKRVPRKLKITRVSGHFLTEMLMTSATGSVFPMSNLLVI